jgi:hypothetical protein
VDFLVCGGGFTSCSPLLVNEGDGVLKVVLPCLKLPIGLSTSELLSTLNTFTPSVIGDLNSGTYF